MKLTSDIEPLVAGEASKGGGDRFGGKIYTILLAESGGVSGLYKLPHWQPSSVFSCYCSCCHL